MFVFVLETSMKIFFKITIWIHSFIVIFNIKFKQKKKILKNLFNFRISKKISFKQKKKSFSFSFVSSLFEAWSKKISCTIHQFKKKFFNIFGIVFFWIFGSYLRLFNEHNIKIWKYFIYLSYEQYQNSNRNSFFLLLGED